MTPSFTKPTTSPDLQPLQVSDMDALITIDSKDPAEIKQLPVINITALVAHGLITTNNKQPLQLTITNKGRDKLIQTYSALCIGSTELCDIPTLLQDQAE